MEVRSRAYFSADCFEVGFSLGADSAYPVDFFYQLNAEVLTIYIGLTPFSYSNLLVGQIDNIRYDLSRNVIFICGRDLSARLIDNELSETFVNQTSSQIAQIIAARRELSGRIETTGTAVGQYYELDHARSALGLFSRGGTEWNLLSWLAQVENFTLSVTGTELYFGPALETPAVYMTPAAFSALSFDVATTLPQSAIVKSWNTKAKSSIAQTVGAGDGLSTTIIRPNLTNSQAQMIASNHLVTLSQHATLLEAEMPGELTMRVGNLINLTGTNSAFDQTYRVSSLTRILDSRRGFKQMVRAYSVAGA